MTAWPQIPLGKTGRWVSGNTPTTSNSNYWGGDLPWMSAKSLTDFSVLDSGRRLTAEGAGVAKLVPTNAILMVVRGMSLKSEFRMGITRRSVAISQDLKALLPNRDIDPLFLAYALEARSGEVLGMVDEAGHGTGRLQTDRLYALPISVPDMREQRAISTILGTLDDKIESNQAIKETCLTLAKTLLSTGEEHVRVGDVARVAKGLSYKGAGLDDGSAVGAVPMLNLGSYTKSGALNWEGMKYYAGEFKDKHVLAPWDLVIANTDLTQAREFIGRGILIPTSLDGAIHTHHTSRVIFEQREELALFLWAQLESPAFRSRAMGYATGTTVIALPPEAVLDFEMTVPWNTHGVLKTARTLIEHAWQKHDETTRLAALRKTLLPELLSGRIRVPEAQEVAA